MNLTIKEDGRLASLDLARFTAAISVVLYHYLYRGWRADNLSDLSFFNYDGFLKYGYLGVQLFFIISGFSIGISIEKKNNWDFFISRFSRLYPAYWICATITLIFIYTLDDGRFYISPLEGIANLSMISKLFGIPFIDGAYWTLIYEIIFYFWVFIIITLGKRDIFMSLTPLLILGIIGQLIDIDQKISVIWGGSFLCYFLVGLGFYKAYRGKIKKIEALVFLSAILACYLQCYMQVSYKNSATENIQLNPWISFLIISSFLLFFAGLSKRKLKIPNLKLIRTLGALTYPCYLLHQNIGYIVFNKFGNEQNQLILLIITLSLVIFASHLIAKNIEPLMIKSLKNKLKVGFDAAR